MSGLLGRRAPDLATNVATAIQARAGKTRCGIFRGTKRASTASPTSAGPPAHEVTGQPVSDRCKHNVILRFAVMLFSVLPFPYKGLVYHPSHEFLIGS